MIRNILLTALLFAIAHSQILGGIACCCFIQAVSERVVKLTEFDANSHTVDDGAAYADSLTTDTEPATYRCPKCAAKVSKFKTNVSEVKDYDARRDAESARLTAPCNCYKFEWQGSEVNESPTLKTKVGGVQWIVVDVSKSDTQTWQPQRQSRVPHIICLGKHSWQSLACIWKN